MLEPLKKDGKLESFNLNCTDPLGRTSMTISIENESFEMIEVLLEFGINVADGLLHAISEDYVEAAELLLEWEEKNHKEGTPYVRIDISIRWIKWTAISSPTTTTDSLRYPGILQH